MKHGRVMAGAAGHVDRAASAQPLEQPAVEGLFVGQPLRPVDHRLVNVGKVVEHVAQDTRRMGGSVTATATTAVFEVRRFIAAFSPDYSWPNTNPKCKRGQ